MFETRGRSSPRRWPLWKGCELCGHNLKLHDEKGRCSVCRAGWSLSPCYGLVSFELPADPNEPLIHKAAEFRVTPEELVLILLEVNYYCDTFLGLPASKTDAMIGEAVERGDMMCVTTMRREVTEEEKRRIAEAFALLLEKDGFFRKIVKKHRIPAPNYIAVFHHILISKVGFLPGVVEALERRVKHDL
jgi:hypothetical protein